MEPCVSCNGCKNIKFFVLTGFVEIFAAEQYAVKFELSSLIVKKLFGWVVQSKAAPSRKVVEVLATKMRKRKKGAFFPSLQARVRYFCERRVRNRSTPQSRWALTAVHVFTAGALHVQGSFSWISWEKGVAECLERQHVCAEHSDEDESVIKNGTSGVRSDQDGRLNFH